MKITILAVGRLGRCSEASLSGDYVQRATATGRALGLGPVELIEVEAKKPGKQAEGEVLLGSIPEGSLVFACDEHGQSSGSRDFASQLASLRDRGERRLTVVIGGADGLSQQVLASAQARVAFGAQTWPHALVRVMLCEQIYRAATILAGSPYHRD